MKQKIHPEYHTDAVVICACGHSFTTGSVLKEIKTELCSNCHPFYTGKQKLVDSARRVEKFQAKIDKQKTVKTAHRSKTVKRATKAAKRTERTEKTVTKIGKK